MYFFFFKSHCLAEAKEPGKHTANFIFTSLKTKMLKQKELGWNKLIYWGIIFYLLFHSSVFTEVYVKFSFVIVCIIKWTWHILNICTSSE